MESLRSLKCIKYKRDKIAHIFLEISMHTSLNTILEIPAWKLTEIVFVQVQHTHFTRSIHSLKQEIYFVCGILLLLLLLLHYLACAMSLLNAGNQDSSHLPMVCCSLERLTSSCPSQFRFYHHKFIRYLILCFRLSVLHSIRQCTCQIFRAHFSHYHSM